MDLETLTMLHCNKGLFTMEAPPVASERAVLPHRTMTGDDQSRRIRGASVADGPAGVSSQADVEGHLLVGAGLAVGDGLQHTPDSALKGRGLYVEG